MQPLETPLPTAWHTPRALWLSLLFLALLCIPLFLFRLGGWGLFDADEGRYAEIPRAMLASGDWVTPRLNGVKFFDKPPLLYWMSALCFQLFGVGEGAARLPSALAAMASVFGAYLLGRRMFGPRAGLLGAAILATTVSWPILGRVVLTDMLVSSLVFLALAFWWIGARQSQARAQGWAFFAFWTALALGVLAKGPVAVILVMGTLGAYVILSGEWGSLRKMRWLPGVIWATLLAAPWFFVVQSRNPEYFKAFWIDQNFGRFLGTLAEQDHANGPLYFFEWMPGLLFPWTLFAIPALFVGWKKLFPTRDPNGLKTRSETSRAALFLVCGALAAPLFFSLSSSKLVTYIFPIVPMMAVALGGYFESLLRRENAEPAVSPSEIAPNATAPNATAPGESSLLKPAKSPRAPRVAAFVLALLCLLGGAAGLVFAPPALQKIGAPASAATATCAALLLWGAALAFCAFARPMTNLIAATALGWTLVFTVATGLIGQIAPALTTPTLLQIIRPGIDRGGEIVSLGFTQSLSFYLARRIAMVDSPDELRDGIEHLSPAERSRWFLKSEADLKPYFGKSTPVYLVIRSSRKKSEVERQKIAALGGDFVPVARNSRFTILGNAPARRITPAISDLEPQMTQIKTQMGTDKFRS